MADSVFIAFQANDDSRPFIEAIEADKRADHPEVDRQKVLPRLPAADARRDDDGLHAAEAAVRGRVFAASSTTPRRRFSAAIFVATRLICVDRR
ncbi:MmoB/DmpM family protein [Paraburkholderia atlantica]|uniref:MmoB/DmpM family protein n=1 Tax=Paraburkholderia atlantica TaxID=2654982 RepID=UPI001EE63B73|nr:MmoB/DmpM family protein [Paraburkholderia atlantica]